MLCTIQYEIFYNMTSEDKIKVAITHGDMNGIGYEVILKSLLDNRIYELCTPIVYGSPKIAAYHRKALNITNFSFNNIKTPDEANVKRANLINSVDDNLRVELGKSTTQAGAAAFKSLEIATEALLNKQVDVLVTAPINKHNIQSKDFNFPGHTEYLAKKHNSNMDFLMLMVGENMKVGVVTGHAPLREVPGILSQKLIEDKLIILDKSLKQDFGIKGGRIAVLGLNPHAGDNGLLGNEEIDIIAPAIEKVKVENNILAFGPYPADGFFSSNNYTKFDAVLAMYHDQGLAPFKALEFEYGVNYTAGLPFIRTSPAHGTAYEIAGKDMASPASFRQAIFLACDIYRKREEFEELSSNPLPHYNGDE